jgi:flagellar FliL protein
MPTATAVETPAPAPKGKKKLIIIIAAVAALVLVGGGGGAYFLMKKKATVEADAEAAAGEGAAPAHAAEKHDPKAAPVFVPLDPFTVNLADREADRYAQVGITLEIEDAHIGDQIKAYMPAIRNNILMAIADRTAGDLMGRDGKTRLAERLRRETSRVLGYAVPDEDGAAGTENGGKPEPKTKKQLKAEAEMPVKAVHFSNFIIQ